MTDWFSEDPVVPSFMAELQALEDEHQRAREERALDECRTDWKPARRVSRRDAPRPDIMWRELIFQRDQGCVFHSNPADCDEGMQFHHVVFQQELRRSFPEALWKPESGVCLCGWAHRNFHGGWITLTVEDLPAEVVGYLREIGYGWYLEKHYGHRIAA